jgi:hypothetical protein
MTFKRKAILPIIALALVGVALTVVTAAVLSSQDVPVPSSGTINQIVTTVNVGVFSDSAGTVPCTNIEWGNLNPGATASRTIYIKNTGNVTETLSLSASGWSPSGAMQVLTLGWNREGVAVPINGVVAATITLGVDSNPGSVSSFAFNIIITGKAAA